MHSSLVTPINQPITSSLSRESTYQLFLPSEKNILKQKGSIDSMTVISIVMSNRRGQTARKRPLRLPIIAPKDIITSSNTTLDLPVPKKPSARQHRLRFPPRSRTGCWVKCDEIHPQCNQCARLGHICDYRPRLCFRDDTRRVMERMPDVKLKTSVVWDSRTSAPTVPLTCDMLPPFVMLGSDEERERKAQSAIPGTYHVVAIPESFSQLPEYTDGAADADQSTVSLDSTVISESDLAENDTRACGPDVVILQKFRDTRRPQYFHRRSPSQSPESDPGSSILSVASGPEPIADYTGPGWQYVSDHLDLGHYDFILLDHFRRVVCAQLICGVGIDNGHGLTAEFLEQEAASFPPLYHALTAISALSLARQGNHHNLDPSHYYHQTISTLQSRIQSNEDLLSDGSFLSHFLLLVYEVMACNVANSSLWSHHVSQLLHISLLRRSTPGPEPLPFVVWWVCNVDLYALLSGAGTGEYVRAVLNHQLPLDLKSLFYPIGPEDSSLLYADYDGISTLSRLYYDTIILAIRLGVVSVELRKAKAQSFDPRLNSRQQELGHIREALAGLWDHPEIQYMIHNQAGLPRRSHDMLQQISILFHTCFLFSFTSVYPGQRLGPSAASEESVHHHATMIIQMSSMLLSRDSRGDRPFMVFPLFLSGAVAAPSSLKMMALELLSRLEETDIGSNAATACHILQVIYERQIQHSSCGEHTLGFSWAEVLAEHGLQLVSYK
ncbi:hypothetical protein BO82DRAFT_347741 [Aspergillus uvarum CBS 121591]|uniref:Zn(2)-C6 fungal-type domain-containing protein n=1 Tax=Aspergillus uvarum CBS 121591 TaxID=1448315 RepID=A0A319BX46_9EURO|nr:hypothetical protein BO82DRAFT_347741 [Aspergillus uvarum CBS 121591]PYH76129.1 hypothetical protein BO82DRAFT_347741 [Aspergillus uvarum CBS 121591]